MEDDISEIKKLILSKIVAKRKQLKLTQEQVAQKAEIPKTTYSDAERGATEFNLDRLLRVCAVLDINIFAADDGKNEDHAIQIAVDEQTIADMAKDIKENQKEMKEMKENQEKILSFFDQLKQNLLEANAETKKLE